MHRALREEGEIGIQYRRAKGEKKTQFADRLGKKRRAPQRERKEGSAPIGNRGGGGGGGERIPKGKRGKGGAAIQGEKKETSRTARLPASKGRSSARGGRGKVGRALSFARAEEGAPTSTKERRRKGGSFRGGPSSQMRRRNRGGEKKVRFQGKACSKARVSYQKKKKNGVSSTAEKSHYLWGRPHRGGKLCCSRAARQEMSHFTRRRGRKKKKSLL